MSLGSGSDCLAVGCIEGRRPPNRESRDQALGWVTGSLGVSKVARQESSGPSKTQDPRPWADQMSRSCSSLAQLQRPMKNVNIMVIRSIIMHIEKDRRPTFLSLNRSATYQALP